MVMFISFYVNFFLVTDIGFMICVNLLTRDMAVAPCIIADGWMHLCFFVDRGVNVVRVQQRRNP